MAKILITRPSPGLEQTATRLHAMGHHCVSSPLFTVHPVEWQPPDDLSFDAVMITSANALRHAGPYPAHWYQLPCYAVGTVTAEAAKAAGFNTVITGPGHAKGMVKQMLADGRAHVVHPTARDYTIIRPPHPPIHKVIVYAADPVDGLTQEANQALARHEVDWVLLYSARAAEHFNALSDQAGIDRSKLKLGAISATVAEKAGPGWGHIAIASEPSEDHLFAACDLVYD